MDKKAEVGWSDGLSRYYVTKSLTFLISYARRPIDW